MGAHALYLVRMDVAHDHEATFNEVYDREHVPNLRAVPGARRASRYRQPAPTEPRYLAAYELDGPAVIDSAAWKAAGEAGRWATAVRPHTMNRHRAMYEWVGALPDGGRRGAALSLRVRGRAHRPADVEALERHVGRRALEAGGAAVHLQQALHRRRADPLGLRRATPDRAPRSR